MTTYFIWKCRHDDLLYLNMYSTTLMACGQTIRRWTKFMFKSDCVVLTICFCTVELQSTATPAANWESTYIFFTLYYKLHVLYNLLQFQNMHTRHNLCLAISDSHSVSYIFNHFSLAPLSECAPARIVLLNPLPLQLARSGMYPCLANILDYPLQHSPDPAVLNVCISHTSSGVITVVSYTVTQTLVV
jgi:hypothetical protein